MFDAVLTGGNVPERRFGQSFVVTVTASVLMAAFLGYVSTRPAKVVKKERDVKFVAAQVAPAPPPPPPPPPPGGSKPKVEQQKKPVPVKKPDTLVESKTKDDKPPEPKEPDKKDEGAGQPGGVEGGVDGGVPGGVVGGTIGGTGTGTVVPPPAPPSVMQYDSGGMSPISLRSGSSAPTYPREALEAKVEGKVIARCIITEDGSLVECRIIKGLPFLDQVVLANLSARKYAPILYQGRPVRVYFTFPFTFKLP